MDTTTMVIAGVLFLLVFLIILRSRSNKLTGRKATDASGTTPDGTMPEVSGGLSTGITGGDVVQGDLGGNVDSGGGQHGSHHHHHGSGGHDHSAGGSVDSGGGSGGTHSH